MKVWRIHLKPNPKVSTIRPFEFCKTHSIVGIGWPVGQMTSVLSIEEYELLAIKRYGKPRALKPFLHYMGPGDLCWIRSQGIYHIARIEDQASGGAWKYESEQEFHDADIVNIRRVKFCEVGAEASVPWSIVKSFMGRTTIQRIKHESLCEFTQQVWNDRSAPECPKYRLPVNRNNAELFDLISADGCEDVIAFYIQDKGFQLVPSTCKREKPRYEYDFVHRETGGLATAQVKNGGIDLMEEDYQDYPGDVFLFTSGGKIIVASGPSKESKNKIYHLKTDDVLHYVMSNEQRMPPKIRTWLKRLN